MCQGCLHHDLMQVWMMVFVLMSLIYAEVVCTLT